MSSLSSGVFTVSGIYILLYTMGRKQSRRRWNSVNSVKWLHAWFCWFLVFQRLALWREYNCWKEGMWLILFVDWVASLYLQVEGHDICLIKLFWLKFLAYTNKRLNIISFKCTVRVFVQQKKCTVDVNILCSKDKMALNVLGASRNYLDVMKIES